MEASRWWNGRWKQETEEVKGSRSEGGKGVYGPKTNRGVGEKAEIFYLQYMKVFLNPQIYSLFHMHETAYRITSRIAALRSMVILKMVTSHAKVPSTRTTRSEFEPTSKCNGPEGRIPKDIFPVSKSHPDGVVLYLPSPALSYCMTWKSSTYETAVSCGAFGFGSCPFPTFCLKVFL